MELDTIKKHIIELEDYKHIKELSIDNLPIRTHCKKVLMYHDKISTGKTKHLRMCSDKLDYSKNLVAFSKRPLPQKEEIITYVIHNNNYSKLKDFKKELRLKKLQYKLFNNKIVVNDNGNIKMYDLFVGTRTQASKQASK